MPRFRLRIALRRHDHLLNINKFPQPRLPRLIRQITPRRDNEAHIKDISLLASLGQFLRGVHFGRVCWAGYGFYFLRGGGIGEEEFGDEVAGLAVCGL